MTELPGAPPQRDFAQALLDPDRPPPPGLRAWNGSDPGPRFAVHRNNVVVSLVAVLADTFPVVRQLVGDEFFHAMARRFVCQHPPDSPVMSAYGDAFADWLADFAPAAALPYLPDMARLERLRVRAFHAADAEPVAPAALASALAAPQRLAELQLPLHPSLAVLRASHAVVSLWAAHQSDDPDAIGVVALDEPEAALVLRDGDSVLVLAVPASTADFVDALGQGHSLGAASTRAPDADLAGALALLIRHGALVAGAQPGDPR